MISLGNSAFTEDNNIVTITATCYKELTVTITKDGKLVVEYGDAEKPFTVELPDAKAKVPGIADYVGKEITVRIMVLPKTKTQKPV